MELEDNRYVQKRDVLTSLFDARRELTAKPSGSVANDNAVKGALVSVDTMIEMVKGMPGIEEISSTPSMPASPVTSKLWYALAGVLIISGAVALLLGGSRFWYGVVAGLIVAGIFVWRLK
jgi:hypothetical protein